MRKLEEADLRREQDDLQKELAALLEQTLVAGQYEANVATIPGSRDRVEFAIRLPGRGDGEAVRPLSGAGRPAAAGGRG